MTLVKSYIRCWHCGKKIYPDDYMVQLIDDAEDTCYYCSVECANKKFHFSGKAENVDPFLFYDRCNPDTNEPYEKDKLVSQKIIKKYDKTLTEIIREIRADHDERLYDMAKRLGIGSAELSQTENGHIKDLEKVKNILRKIIKVYQLSNNSIKRLIRGYKITYKEWDTDDICQ